MTLVALANVLLGDADGRALPRRSAGPGHRAAAAGARARATRRSRSPARPRRRARAGPVAGAAAPRRFRSPHTLFPHAQFLSNGSYIDRRHQRRRRRQLLARPRGHAPPRGRDPRPAAASSSTCATSAAAPSGRRRTSPTGPEPDEYLVTFLAEQAIFRRRDDEIETQLDDRGLARGRRRGAAAVAHEPQRPAARDRGHELRRDRARARRPRTSPTRRSASCSSRPSTCRSATALLCRRRPRAADEAAAVGGPRARPRGPQPGARRVGDRSRALPRPRARRPGIRRRSTDARCPARPASCSIRS